MNEQVPAAFDSSTMPSVREIKVFLALGMAHSITDASERLHLSQSQLSRILRGLEEKLATKLFQRSTAGLTLTPEGKIFRGTALNLQMTYLQQMHRFNSELAGESGEVRLTILPSIAFNSLSTWTESFRQSYPQATVTTVDDISGQGLHELLEGRTDVAISACLLRTADGQEHTLFPELNRLKVIPLFAEQFFFVSGPETQVLDKADWKFAFQHANLGFTEKTSIHRSLEMISQFEKAPYLPETRTNSPLTIAGLVGAGLGATIVPDSNLGMMKLKRLPTTPLSGYYRVVCVVTTDTRQTNLVQQFINTLIS